MLGTARAGKDGNRAHKEISNPTHCPVELCLKFWGAISPVCGCQMKAHGGDDYFFLTVLPEYKYIIIALRAFLYLCSFSAEITIKVALATDSVWLRKLRGGSLLYPLPLQPVLKFHASQILKHIFSITLQPWEK